MCNFLFMQQRPCTAVLNHSSPDSIRRDCIIEGEGKASKASSNKGDRTISSEMKWLKDTRWNWNNWREVIFRSEGSFLAPAENCERQGNPNCRWWADDEKIYVKCAAASTSCFTSQPARPRHPIVTRRTHTVPLTDPYAAFLSIPLFAFSRAFAASAQLGSTRSHRIPTSSRYPVRVIATVTRSMPRGSGRGSV